jgi:SSS family solute:Na+ symporter
VTRPRPTDELRGLVYSLTPHDTYEDRALPWHRRPAALAAVVLVATLTLNVIFW